MSLNHSPSIVRDGLVLYYDMSNTQKSFKGAPTTNITPDLGIVQVQSVSCTYVGVEDGWKKYALGGTWTAGTYPYAFAVDAFTCTGGVTYSTGVYVKTNVAPKFAALFTGMNYVNAPMNLGGTSFSITQSDGSIFVGRYGFQYTSTSSQNGYLVSQPVVNQVFDSAKDFLYIKSGQIEQNSFCTPFVAGTRYTNNNLESTPSYPTWNQSAASASGGTLTFTSGSYTNKGTWDLYKTYSGLSTGTNYTWSALVKKGTATNFIVTMNNTQAWDTGPANVFSEFSSTEWKRVSITGTTNSGSFNIHLGSTYNTGFRDTVQTGGTILIQDVRLQLTSSQTAIKDLTDQNTIAATSLTYASDGTFSFDGGSNYLTIPNTTLGNGNIEWTISCWMKTTTATNSLGQGSILSNISGGPVYSMMGVNNGKIVYWTYQNNAWSQKLGVGKTINDGNWHMLTWVNYTNYTMDMYVDGALDSNVANSTSGNNNPVDVIGRSWAGYFPGSIASLTRYIRALSASEVSQNFNALRGKYGI